jgi:hypothetical protein
MGESQEGFQSLHAVRELPHLLAHHGRVSAVDAGGYCLVTVGHWRPNTQVDACSQVWSGVRCETRGDALVYSTGR